MSHKFQLEKEGTSETMQYRLEIEYNEGLPDSLLEWFADSTQAVEKAKDEFDDSNVKSISLYATTSPPTLAVFVTKIVRTL